jgi:hypothetical protein
VEHPPAPQSLATVRPTKGEMSHGSEDICRAALSLAPSRQSTLVLTAAHLLLCDGTVSVDTAGGA